MIPQPEFGRYQAGSGEELLLGFGHKFDRQVLFIESFFEERNLLRRTVVALARRLAESGIGSTIPDLPGCGDSLRDLREIRLAEWQNAVANAGAWLRRHSGGPLYTASIRAGAVLDDATDAEGRWRFAPTGGGEIMRHLRRAAILGADKISFLGYDIGPELQDELELFRPAQATGPMHEYIGERHGVPLWRRAEPGEDADLVEALALDLIAWIEKCGRR
ncbi:MAG: hypothetical protein AB7G25_09850 [Sphingomonadaceae bacterium]